MAEQAFPQSGSPVKPAPRHKPRQVVLAGILDRFLGYSLDALFFLFCCYFTLYILVVHRGWHYDLALLFKCQGVWIALYILYNAFLNSGGRATAGKMIVGVRVVDKKGGPLSLGRSFLRAAGYFVSGFAFELGFVWAALNRHRRTWHDIVAGSVVIESREKSAVGKALVSLASLAVFFVLIGLWIKGFAHLYAERDRKAVEQAYIGLRYVANLEELYKDLNGSYTGNVENLARLTDDVYEFQKTILQWIEPRGFFLEVYGDRYVIMGRAKNPKKTLVKLEGP